jgi:hypothetical protein
MVLSMLYVPVLPPETIGASRPAFVNRSRVSTAFVIACRETCCRFSKPTVCDDIPE